MTIPADALPAWLAGLAVLIFLSVVIWDALHAPWRVLHANRLHNLFSVAGLLLAGLWWFRAGAHAGLEFHLLGITAMVLIFGHRLAMVGGFLALALLTVIGSYDGAAFGVNGLLGVTVPVILAEHLHRLIYRWLPKHFFVYVLVSAHFSSMLVIATVVVSGGVLLLLTLGAHPWDRVSGEYLIVLPLVMLPEGFMNGAIMTLLTVLRPEWVRSFDDRDYLKDK